MTDPVQHAPAVLGATGGGPYEVVSLEGEPDDAVDPAEVLVLGSVGHAAGVTAYHWYDIPQGLNVGDFRFILLNLSVLAEPDYVQQIEVARLPPWEQFTRAMFAEAVIIAIGEPWLKFSESLDAYYWLSYRPQHHREHGRGFETPDDDEIASYFEAVDLWTFYWTRSFSWVNRDQRAFLDAVSPLLGGAKVRAEPLVSNRVGNALALSITYSAAIVGPFVQGETFTGTVPTRTGPIFLLPTPTAWSATEAIDFWLRRLGVAAEHEPPTWAAHFVLPAEVPLREREKQLRVQLAETTRLLSDLAVEQTEAGKWRQLLYETGEVLEVVVRDALATLGATVSNAPAQGREDGRVVDPAGREAVLEVKGLTGPTKRIHVRQLRQWTDDFTHDEDRVAKGLLVVNAFAQTPPLERGPVIDEANATLARRWQQCIVSTPQLFAAVVADQSGGLDRDAFWNALFDASGLVALPDP